MENDKTKPAIPRGPKKRRDTIRIVKCEIKGKLIKIVENKEEREISFNGIDPIKTEKPVWVRISGPSSIRTLKIKIGERIEVGKAIVIITKITGLTVHVLISAPPEVEIFEPVL